MTAGSSALRPPPREAEVEASGLGRGEGSTLPLPGVHGLSSLEAETRLLEHGTLRFSR